MIKRLLTIIFLFVMFVSKGQTPISIYCPDFTTSYQGGWQINNNAVFINPYLRLTPNSGNQSGSAFWKQKISLPTNFSFSVYFTSKMTPGSRADGMTFCIQQASNTAGSSGGGLGYQGMPGKSIAIEYDTYNNGEINNNHIALDINGVLHGSTNVVSSPVDLADKTMKYNWIDYNGATQILEVRISNTLVRPTLATLTVSNLNLASNFLNNTDVYFGFTAATGGATEEHAVYGSLAINSYSPITSTTGYKQGITFITVTSSTNLTCLTPSTTLTITAKDALSNVVPFETLNLSFDVGGGTLSSTSVITNSVGQATVTYSNATASSNTLRVTDPLDGAYGTQIITKTGNIPIGGTLSSNTNYNGSINTGTLNLVGSSGGISKWQKSIDNGTTWTDIINTTTSYTYSNLTTTTLFRVVVGDGTCSYVNSTTVTITITNYTISGVVTLPIGIVVRPTISLYYVGTTDSLIGTQTVSVDGSYSFTPNRLNVSYKITPTLSSYDLTSNDFSLLYEESKNVNVPPILPPGLVLISGQQMKAGDLNQDGKIDMGDAYLCAANLTKYRLFSKVIWFTPTVYNLLTVGNFSTITPSNYFTITLSTSSVIQDLKYITLGDVDLSSSSK
jgi:hypothetical protein